MGATTAADMGASSAAIGLSLAWLYETKAS
jgi:hypothetical protein